MPAVLDRPAAAPVHTSTLLEIVVSHEDIRDGVLSDRGGCAVARALYRAGYRGVSVMHSGVYADGNEYVVTTELSHWLADFDRGREFVHPDRWVLSPLVPATAGASQ